jgi:RND superfamily putative drug exporter
VAHVADVARHRAAGGVAGAVGQFAVSTDDTARFLPSDAPSRQALEIGREDFGLAPGTSTVTALVERVDGRALGTEDSRAIEGLRAVADGWRPDVDALDVEDEFIDVRDRAGAVLSATVGPSAPDRRFVLIGLEWRANTIDPVAHSAFKQLRDALTERAGRAGLSVAFTGGVASVNDADEAQAVRATVQGVLLFVAIVALSFLFLRGVLAAVLPLLVVALVAAAAGASSSSRPPSPASSSTSARPRSCPWCSSASASTTSSSSSSASASGCGRASRPASPLPRRAPGSHR